MAQTTRGRDKSWQREAYKNLLDYRAGKISAAQLITSVIASDPFVARKPDANVFTQLNTFLEILVEQAIRWKAGTLFEGILDHANSADRTYGFLNKDGTVPLVIAGNGIFQSGATAFVAGTATVVFPVAYTSAPFVFGIVVKAAAPVHAVQIATPTLTGVVASRSAPAGAATFYWFAIGPV